MILDLGKISRIIKEEISAFQSVTCVDESGRVQSIGDGMARVTGLSNCMSGELLVFENGVRGIAMNLEESNIAVMLLGKDTGVSTGDFVARTGEVVHMPVGDMLLGRVVDALGEPIDQRGRLIGTQSLPIERVAPGVLDRRAVDRPLHTGIKAIDSMVPIGRGQRQLIIGDRQVGKTALAIDTIINQRAWGVRCVYVAIGQKNSTVAGIVGTLEEHGALEYTTVVVAGAAEAASLQYLAPYSGCAVAEYWMAQGQDVLIVFDDLSKHAVAYRTMSLLMHRPPGREAYPGDVFYLHSRLLERAGRLNEEHGGGSITALPIVETQGGDMSAYIPTNVISITDGQIYLETELFNSGIRPAINPGLSVSRVGGKAQVSAMKRTAAPLRTELAQYRELAAFAQFSSDLDQDTRKRLRHGERIVEILKQQQYRPVPMEEEIAVLLAVTRGVVDSIPVEEVGRFEKGLLAYLRENGAAQLQQLRDTGELGEQLEQELMELVHQYAQVYNKGAVRLRAAQ